MFAGEHNDYKYETVRPLVRALVGGELGENPCPAPSTGLEEKITALEIENGSLREQIKQVEKEYDDEIDELKGDHKDETKFLRGQIKGKNTTIGVLSMLLTLTLGTIIGFLIYDYLNLDVGFFWLK